MSILWPSSPKKSAIFSQRPLGAYSSADACNARAAWGSGVAVAFKQKYPYAFRKYNAHCLSPPTGSKLSVKQHQANLVGTTLLVPPPTATKEQQASKTPHYVACLFTSLDYGKKVSPAKEILENTQKALADLANQIAEIRGSDEDGGQELGSCYAVRINSGRFGVEWQKTKAVLEAGELDITIVRPEGEENASGAGNTAREKLDQPHMRNGGAKGSKPSKAARPKAERPFAKQMGVVKRKIPADVDGDDNSGRENTTGKETAPLHPGIAKRMKRLGSDG